MKPAQTTNIVYVKQNGELTKRDIIAVDVPGDQIKAIDVTGWDQVSCSIVETLVSEYKEYKKNQIKQMFTFEDWLSHTGNNPAENEVKWRTFKLDGILDESPTEFEGTRRRRARR